ncbi:growth arrest-specific protein 1 isoform X2 [Rhinatrema bivittatum]|uniref:growth arrest-specific protein 1 isoform X2 n=1 Tax=Rhinatrema bivittatum TaxID=194408 RepID=UPI00112718A3|nr:growth arrest-specific protein 1 isoform X2 [Rhinatrema bivittatum]
MRRGSGGGRTPRLRPPPLLLVLPPLLLLLSSRAQGRRLVCWQAVLQCQGEPECIYAYNQYSEACAPVFLLPLHQHGAEPPAAPPPPPRRRCPSHCISALIQLNHTRGGPALEDCDCAQDEVCRATKRAIEPCLPRTGPGPSSSSPGGGGGGGASALGCTEARRRCERDLRCSLALAQYLRRCGKLFDGRRCTAECRAVIEDMLQVPRALLLRDCVCDGLERPICEAVKENMARLCFEPEAAGSSGGPDDYDEDDYYEDAVAPRSEDEQEVGPEPGAGGEGSGGGPGRGAAGAPLLLGSLLLHLLPLPSPPPVVLIVDAESGVGPGTPCPLLALVQCVRLLFFFFFFSSGNK